MNKNLTQKLWASSKAALDLASVMVGILILGLIAGVVAATVFAVIPWAQDNTAKDNLKAIEQAQNSYAGLNASSSVMESLTQSVKTDTFQPGQSFADKQTLLNKKLLTPDNSINVTVNGDGSCYIAVSQSATGKVFYNTSDNTDPQVLDVTKPAPTLNCTATFPTLPGVKLPDPPAPVIPPVMQSTWDTTTCPTIKLPVSGLGSTFSVDWGDGKTQNVTTNTPSHTYTDGVASHTITTKGTFNAWSMDPATYTAGANCLTSIPKWEDGVGTTDLSYAFAKATSLGTVVIPSTVQTLAHAFDSNSTFNDPSVSNWNVSNVTNLSYTFYLAKAFNQNINNWNVSKVTDMSFLFSNALAFNQPLNNWDVSKTTTLNNTFATAKLFNQNINNWNVSNVTDMFNTFAYAAAFNQPLNSWNTAKVTTMNCMFCYGYFNQPIGSWNTGNVTDMTSMFALTYAFNQPLNTWDTSKVTNMSQMFSMATVFNQPLNNWNVSNVTDMTAMFQQAPLFNSSLAGWNTGKVTTMERMFYQAKAFNQPINTWNVSNVTTLYSTFATATAFNQPLNSWNTGKVTSLSSTFNGAKAFNQNINTWNVSNVTDMTGTFNGASAFNQPLNSWNTGNTTTMGGLFSGATVFNQNISTWNVAKVTYHNSFNTSSALIAANLPKWVS